MTKHVEENNVCLPVVRAEGRYICALVAAQWEGSRKITTFLVGQSGGEAERAVTGFRLQG